MPIYYQFDIERVLREGEFDGRPINEPLKLRKATLQSIREGDPISFLTLSRICKAIGCQPGDIIAYLPIDEYVKFMEYKARLTDNPATANEIRLKAQLAKIQNLP